MSKQQKNLLLQWALFYSQLGYRILPVKEGAKSALFRDWPSQATSDEAMIRGWWVKWPAANVAILCDKIVVLDFDDHNSEFLQKLEADLRSRYVKVITPRGGSHIYLKLHHGKRWKPVNGVVEKVDVRTANSYVLTPPSRVEPGFYT